MVDFKYNTNSCLLQKFSDGAAVFGVIVQGDEEEYRRTIVYFVYWSIYNHLQLNNTSKTKQMIVGFRGKKRTELGTNHHPRH